MTPGALRALQELAEDEDKDILVEGREAFVGNRRTTVLAKSQALAELRDIASTEAALNQEG